MTTCHSLACCGFVTWLVSVVVSCVALALYDDPWVHDVCWGVFEALSGLYMTRLVFRMAFAMSFVLHRKPDWAVDAMFSLSLLYLGADTYIVRRAMGSPTCMHVLQVVGGGIPWLLMHGVMEMVWDALWVIGMMELRIAVEHSEGVDTEELWEA